MQALIKLGAFVAAACVGIAIAGGVIAAVGSVLDAPRFRNNALINNLGVPFVSGIALILGLGLGVAVYRFVRRRFGHAQ